MQLKLLVSQGAKDELPQIMPLVILNSKTIEKQLSYSSSKLYQLLGFKTLGQCSPTANNHHKLQT